MSDKHTGTAMAVVERPESQALSPVVAMGMEIMRQNPSPETLRELLKVQQEWEANEARKAYAAAMVALKRDLPTVVAKDTTVDFTGPSGKRTFYKHASLAGLMDAITEPLTAHGFSLAWKSGAGPNGVSVTCRLTHSAGHFEESPPHTAAPDASGSKSGPQAIASTMTLLQRYSLTALLGIATRDMDEPKGEEEEEQKPTAPDLTRVDSERNMKLVGWLKTHGKSRAEAEEFMEGRLVKDWTEGDVQRLIAWAKTPREPGGGE